jgi:hypothetical protein
MDYTVPDMFAGSILDLEPGTEYEARFQMDDPDGVTGNATQTVKARTRAEPKAATGGRVLHVYPPSWKGEKQEPSFTGLKAAYKLRRRRLEHHHAAQGGPRRHNPGPRRPLQRQPLELHRSAVASV